MIGSSISTRSLKNLSLSKLLGWLDYWILNCKLCEKLYLFLKCLDSRMIGSSISTRSLKNLSLCKMLGWLDHWILNCKICEKFYLFLKMVGWLDYRILNYKFCEKLYIFLKCWILGWLDPQYLQGLWKICLFLKCLDEWIIGSSTTSSVKKYISF